MTRPLPASQQSRPSCRPCATSHAAPSGLRPCCRPLRCRAVHPQPRSARLRPTHRPRPGRRGTPQARCPPRKTPPRKWPRRFATRQLPAEEQRQNGQSSLQWGRVSRARSRARSHAQPPLARQSGMSRTQHGAGAHRPCGRARAAQQRRRTSPTEKDRRSEAPRTLGSFTTTKCCAPAIVRPRLGIEHEPGHLSSARRRRGARSPVERGQQRRGGLSRGLCAALLADGAQQPGDVLMRRGSRRAPCNRAAA